MVGIAIPTFFMSSEDACVKKIIFLNEVSNSMCLKISSQFLVKSLSPHLQFVSFSRYFPEHLKIANAIPLYKSDDSMFFNNYRPVSVLCVLSKIFEKIM